MDPCKHLKVTATDLQTVLNEINEKKIYDNYYSWFENDFVNKISNYKKKYDNQRLSFINQYKTQQPDSSEKQDDETSGNKDQDSTSQHV